jgi:hypothetical protein
VELRQALTALALLLPSAALAEVERYAVVVGNDLGLPPDVPLRYAEVDAARVASVLQEVGGVRPENTVLLQGKDADTVRRALIAVNERVRSAGRSTVLLVYYSGHADAGALHLGTSRLELAELEQLVRGSAAAFRLLVLDSCRSGALTRVKGGTPIPPFDIQLGERVAGEGAVFLTSSSASEDSQESDELKGSFFTHALLSGLLGAADENGDGKVTLDEAYRHAYEATLRASSRTLSGTQHPTFQYDLRGAGDLVLASLDARSPTRAWLELPPGKTWLVFQENAEGAVVGEVSSTGRVRRLSLRPGRYFLRGRGPEVLLEGTVVVAPGSTVTVDEAKLQRTAYARLVRKGEGSRDSVLSLEVEVRVRSALVTDAGVCPGVGVALAIALRSITLVPRVSWCQSGYSNEGLHATTDQWDFELQGSYVWDLAPVSIELGLIVGGSLFHQSFSTTGSAPPRTTGALELSPIVGVSRDLGSQTYLYLSVAGATYLFKNETTASGTTSFGPSFAVRVALGFGWRF